MADSKLNRVLDNGIWRYLDNRETEFVLISEASYPVVAVDDFIDGRHGLTPPNETIDFLLELRGEALQAFLSKSHELMEAKLEALHMACRVAGMYGFAATGQKFKQGRKLGAVGPIRKKIAGLLKKFPSMKNVELWEAIKAKPPKGWEVIDNHRAGKYLEGPTASDNMGYPRFCNVAAEIRGQFKGWQITG